MLEYAEYRVSNSLTLVEPLSPLRSARSRATPCQRAVAAASAVESSPAKCTISCLADDCRTECQPKRDGHLINAQCHSRHLEDYRLIPLGRRASVCRGPLRLLNNGESKAEVASSATPNRLMPTARVPCHHTMHSERLTNRRKQSPTGTQAHSHYSGLRRSPSAAPSHALWCAVCVRRAPPVWSRHRQGV